MIKRCVSGHVGAILWHWEADPTWVSVLKFASYITCLSKSKMALRNSLWKGAETKDVSRTSSMQYIFIDDSYSRLFNTLCLLDTHTCFSNTETTCLLVLTLHIHNHKDILPSPHYSVVCLAVESFRVRVRIAFLLGLGQEPLSFKKRFTAKWENS